MVRPRRKCSFCFSDDQDTNENPIYVKRRCQISKIQYEYTAARGIIGWFAKVRDT